MIYLIYLTLFFGSGFVLILDILEAGVQENVVEKVGIQA